MDSHVFERQTRTDILLYCGIAEKSWNGIPIDAGGYACVSPISGKSERTKKETCVYVPPGTQVIQDSGAFSDNWTSRLDFGAALERQQRHAEKYGYAHLITHRATYDLLIDEVWSDGNRSKRRWSATEAESAIEETINAARYLNQHRAGESLIVSAQGVDAPQYLRCVQGLLPFFKEGDILGLGGWCITGKMPRQMMTVFSQTVKSVIPFIAGQGIQRVHLWGVVYPAALAALYNIAHEHGIAVSTDSMGVNLNPAYGSWGYGSWRDNSYCRPDASLLGEHRAKHARITREWLNVFADSTDYLSRFADLPIYNRDSVTSKPCNNCGKPMVLKRQHARSCSDSCRKALSRRGA